MTTQKYKDDITEAKHVFRHLDPPYKQIGTYYKKTKKFVKHVTWPKDYLTTPPAFAWDIHVMEVLTEYGCEMVIHIDDERKITWTIAFEKIKEKHGKLNRGYGDQIFVTLDNWSSNQMKQPSLFSEVN